MTYLAETHGCIPLFGETQPRISNQLKGEISRFSVDKLINMFTRAGMRVRVDVESKAA